VRGTLDLEALPLALAVLFWLPGFDIIYALLDVEFDRSHGLFSVPARFGVKTALSISRALHALAWACLALTGLMFGLGPLYWAGMLVVAGLLVYEHSLVRPDDLSRLDMAFFNMNGYISVTVFLFIFLDVVAL
jgi:4-hydroxybenzoate polyprenyltransferase